jgi:large subunit ribosomal protein L21
MHAIVELNGKQYQVEAGRYIDVDLVDLAPEASLSIDKVLVCIDGSAVQVGQPYVAGATVQAKVLNHYRDKKILVYKMRRKKGYRLKNGHRQDKTRLQVEAIKLA